MDEEGYAIARKGLGVARKRYTNMTSLNLPTGKSAEDMKADDGSKDKDKEVHSGGVVSEGEVDMSTSTPTTDSTVLKDKAEKMAVLRWKHPDGRILALRRMAKESGKGYEDRIKETKGKQAVVWKP
jgi:hypothetical protein